MTPIEIGPHTVAVRLPSPALKGQPGAKVEITLRRVGGRACDEIVYEGREQDGHVLFEADDCTLDVKPGRYVAYMQAGDCCDAAQVQIHGICVNLL